MFVALKAKDRSRVTSIAPQWDDRLHVLRELAASGQLICPGCAQLLWLRTPTERRRHFAHRRLADCPLDRQSPEVLEAKAQLYRWLETKYPGRVSVDIEIGEAGSAKLMDLLVEAEPGRKFGYWVFDRQQRSRDELRAYERLPGLHVHFIHTESTLEVDAQTGLALTASQRDFIAGSEYDTAVGWRGSGHLHFLLVEKSLLRIYRGLRCVHRPNLYRWVAQRQHPLAEALISPLTGEMVFAEDVAARKEWRRKSAPAKAPEPPAPASQNRPRQEPESVPMNEPGEVPRPAEEPVEPPPNLNGPFRCEDCGTLTTDWSEATPSAGTCVCRDCVKRRWQQGPGSPSVASK